MTRVESTAIVTVVSRILIVTVTLAVTGLLGRAQAPVRYVYDELGRLVAVMAPSGEAAVYAYDAVGNLLSITRTPATTVSVVIFTPAKGPIGTTVAVHGTGFSATPAQNTVTVNGTSATVASATTTQLVITVPLSATTGPIAVTSPNGSATSAGSFAVTSAAAAPAITQFSPVIGTWGTAVTIDGSDFDAVLANNTAVLNVLRFALSAATSSSLSTVVPTGATSGRISITTPNGTAVSTDDFFVPPYAYTASDVVYTARIPFDTAHTATIGTAQKIGLLLFDGTVGQRVFLKVGGGIASTASMISPDNVTMGSTNFGGAINSYIDTLSLNRAGTYTIVADPNGSNAGNLTLTLYDVPADATGSLTFGTALSRTLSVGQDARLTFAGTSSHRLSMNVGGGLSTAISIVRPDGTVQEYLTKGPLSVFLDPITLASSGTHVVFLNPSGFSSGTASVTVYDVPDDVTGSMTPTTGGSSEPVSIGTPGQNAVYTFSGTVDQRVSLKVTHGGVGSTTSIRRPDGSTQASVTTSGFGSSPFIDAMTLASTATYSILFDPTKTDTGTSTLTLYDVPADLTGTLTINAAATAVSIGTPGQNAEYTFNGTSSQQVTVRITGNTYASVKVSLLQPNGSELTSTTSTSTSFNLSQMTLPTTGTYRVVINPQTSSTGTLNVAVTNP